MTAGPPADGEPGPASIRLRSIAAAVYLPSLLYGIGQGAIAPVVVLSALDLGASAAVAFLIAALAGLGQVVTNLPAGQAVARIGERRAMHAAVVLVIGGLVACATAPAVWVLGAGVVATGAAASVWGLARQLFIAEAIPYEMRGRAMATLGGVQRIGVFVGPLLAAGLIHLMGLAGAYWLHIGLAVAASSVLLATRDPVGYDPTASHDTTTRATLRVVRQHLPVLRTLGLGSLLVSAVRAGRQAVIPLWGTHIGLDPATVSLVFGLSGATDMLVFYPAGFVMDRHGRRTLSAVAMGVLGLSFALLPLATNLVSFIALAAAMGVGNGLSAGLIMTIGADAAPVGQRGQFLGAFRLWADSGGLAGPLVISGVAATAGLVPAILVMGVVGWLAAASMLRWVPKTRTVRADSG